MCHGELEVQKRQWHAAVKLEDSEAGLRIRRSKIAGIYSAGPLAPEAVHGRRPAVQCHLPATFLTELSDRRV
jgi:hypothetical protein